MKRIMFLAVVALVAFAGVAYAAGSITGKSIKDSTITGKDVKNKSLSAKDFKGSVRGPQGPKGDTGAQGPAGAQGPQGQAGPSVLSGITIYSGSGTVAAGAVDGGFVSCPSGQHALGGGFFNDSGVVFLNAMADNARTGWGVAIDNSASSVDANLSIEVYCAGAGKAVAASSHRKLRAFKGRSLRHVNARRAAVR